MIDSNDTKVKTLLSRVKSPFTGEAIFDELQDTVFFIKNEESRYLVVNQTLVDRCGLRSKSQLIGRTAAEILKPPLGSSFTQQDLQVVRTGKAMKGLLELHTYPGGDVGWCLTSKHPLQDRGGRTIGLVGVSHDLRRPNQTGVDYESIRRAVEFVRSNPSRTIRVEQLLKMTGLSRFQLDRRMELAFGLTTGQWILKSRIDSACERLQSSDESIASVARFAGYSDQSSFSRQFRRVTGLTPKEYRDVHLVDASLRQ
ncbi:MAG: AraC family transcriptional regulator [Planctomycetota bacterium]